LNLFNVWKYFVFHFKIKFFFRKRVKNCIFCQAIDRNLHFYDLSQIEVKILIIKEIYNKSFELKLSFHIIMNKLTKPLNNTIKCWLIDIEIMKKVLETDRKQMNTCCDEWLRWLLGAMKSLMSSNAFSSSSIRGLIW